MKLLLPLLSGIPVFLFWYLVYPNHIYYQEYFTLFENTPDYFVSFLGKPGGLSEWAGAFLSQFYRKLWVGAFLQTLFPVLVYIFVSRNKVVREYKTMAEVMALFPALMLVFLQSHYAFVAAYSLRIVLWFAFFYGYSYVEGIYRRGWIAVLFVCPAIMLLGAFPSFLWMLTVILSGIRKKNKSLLLFLLPVAWLICSGIFRFSFPIADKEWFTLFPHLQDFLYPGIAWLLYLWMPVYYLLVLVRQYIHPVKRQFALRRIGGILWIGFLIGSLYWGTQHLYHPNVEQMLRLYRDAVRGDWDGILEVNRHYQGSLASNYVLTNLALVRKSELPDRAFDFPQHGIGGLMLTGGNAYFRDFYLSLLYETLGVKNEALHWCVEACLPYGDNPPPFLLQRMARLLIELGREPAAAMYLKRLVAVPFYCDWAREHLQHTSRTEFLYRQKLSMPFQADTARKKLPDTTDFFIGAMGELNDLLQLAKNHPGNQNVRDYLLVALLLEKDVKTFYKWFLKYYPSGLQFRIPRVYREALMIIGYNGTDKEVVKKYPLLRTDFENFGTYMSRCHLFGNDKTAASIALKKEYGNTYWYYLHFK